jgi:hypothetical protein
MLLRKLRNTIFLFIGKIQLEGVGLEPSPVGSIEAIFTRSVIRLIESFRSGLYAEAILKILFSTFFEFFNFFHVFSIFFNLFDFFQNFRIFFNFYPIFRFFHMNRFFSKKENLLKKQ